MAEDASLNTVSEECFAFSRARAAGILKLWVVAVVVDMAVVSDSAQSVISRLCVNEVTMEE